MDLREQSTCFHCRFRSKAIDVLSDEDLGLLGSACIEVRLDRSEYFFREGSPAGHVVYLREGLARIHKKGPRNVEQILKIASPGAYLGIQTILGHVVNQYSASALTAASACYIQVDSFRELIQRNGDFANELIVYICQDELGYFNRFVSNWQKQLNGRLAETLLYFSEEIFKSSTYPLLVTRKELASMVGGTRESVSRALKEFSDSGIIRLEKNQVRLLNPDLLRRLAETG